MGTPATTARVAPLGVRMGDGFSTKIAFAADPNIEFWELTVGPPGLDGGDAIETTTMHNVTWRSMQPRALLTLSQFSLTALYDPLVYDSIIALINVETDITVHFPDADTLDFFGFLQNFEPQDHEEGSPPTATVTITPTNVDPADGSEAAPVMSGTTGT